MSWRSAILFTLFLLLAAPASAQETTEAKHKKQLSGIGGFIGLGYASFMHARGTNALLNAAIRFGGDSYIGLTPARCSNCPPLCCFDSASRFTQ